MRRPVQVLQSREYMDAVLERTPMKRVGKPEEVAGAAPLHCAAVPPCCAALLPCPVVLPCCTALPYCPTPLLPYCPIALPCRTAGCRLIPAYHLLPLPPPRLPPGPPPH